MNRWGLDVTPSSTRLEPTSRLQSTKYETQEKMFGLIISGRPVDASPHAITETQYAFRIPSSPPFHHIVVFILPGTQLPPDTAATAYVQIPPSQEFKLLGGIGPGKESAIFKVSGVKPDPTGSNGGTDAEGDVMTDDVDPALTPSSNAQAVGGEITVGISIEPAAQVEAQLANLKTTSSQPSQTSVNMSSVLARRNAETGEHVARKVLAQRIIQNAFNFLASFGSDTVPLKAFEEWWKKFEKRVELDPSFLERAEEG